MPKLAPPPRLTEQVFTRLTKQEVLAIRIALNAECRTVSAFIRRAILRDLERGK